MSRTRCLRALAGAVVLGVAAQAAATDLVWLSDRVAVHDFVDGVLAAQIASDRVVGATVSIVHGNELVLAQGYGIADRATDRPVGAADTLFRIGSVSKLFVWVAVMQQVAAGRLDLNTDVNSYLKALQIPETFPEPITLTHLMTHTAGFEDRPVIGLFARGPQTIGDFHGNLISMQPRRVMMPGRNAAYSNYGAALAAHLVEIASNEEWDDYVDRHILKPLGMMDTTTRQPLPEALAERVSNGYVLNSGRYVKESFEFVTIPPAGSISSTATDMARFMMELLARGDTPALAAAARAGLFAPGYQHDPRLGRMRHGIYEQNSHGQSCVGHNGGTMAFHTMLLLCPSHDIGIFASYNNEGGAVARDELFRALLDRLFGPPARPAKLAEAVNAERYSGFYASMRSSSSGHDKIQSLLETFEVGVDADGYLWVAGERGPRRFVKVGDDLFEQENGRERIAFRGAGAQATHLFVDSAPPIDFARVNPRDTPPVQGGLLIVVLLLTAAAWLLWPLSWLGHRGRIAVRGEKRATLLALSTSAMIIGFCVVVANAGVQYRELVFGIPTLLERALWIPIALIPLLLLQLVYGYRAWVGGLWWVTRRIHYTLLTFAAVAFVAWAIYWNLTAVIIDI